MTALFLRLGLGLVFLIGGISKLSILLSGESNAIVLSNYMSATGYIIIGCKTIYSQYDCITPRAAARLSF